MTLPLTRHLDALVAREVLQLPDVRLGWMVWDGENWIAWQSDPGDTLFSPRRDYVYKAREATELDSGYERVPDFASDGNAMLRLIEKLERQGVTLTTIARLSPERYVVRFADRADGYSAPWCGAGYGTSIPEAACWSLLDLATIWHRASGDQTFDLRTAIAGLVSAAEAAEVEVA
jgi:hypothetical protein